MPNFSQDWFLQNVKYWERLIVPRMVGKKGLNFLEIGCFEGRATLWMLENILTGEGSRISVIDTFEGSFEHRSLNLGDLENTFRKNIEKYESKVNVRKGYSSILLKKNNPEEKFDLIYIDGSHQAVDVLSDAILSFPLLKTGGIMIFDDYTWMLPGEPDNRPGIAINAFLEVYRGKYQLIHVGWQVFLEKLKN